MSIYKEQILPAINNCRASPNFVKHIEGNNINYRGAQQANFLQLHLKADALRYILTLPEDIRLVFADIITVLRNRLTQDDLRENSTIKLEKQKFNSKTDTVKNFLVKSRKEANKAHPPPEIVVAPARGVEAEARRVKRKTAARESVLEMSENRKNAFLLILCQNRLSLSC